MDKENTIFIGIDEACKITGLGRNTMLDLVKLDGCPSIKFGKRKIFLNKQQFLEWLNSLTNTFWCIVKIIK